MRTGIWWIKLKERGNLEDLGVDGRNIYYKLGKRVWNGVISDYSSYYPKCSELLD
jgi:hypothetical protein